MDVISKLQSIMFGEDNCMPYNFYMTVICNKTATQKDTF